LGAGASCGISVTFSPTASGTRTATLSVSDSSPGSPHTASLAGTGLAPAASLSPSTLTFSGQQVGTSSSAHSVTLTNSGGAALSISSISITGGNSGDFSKSTTCGSSLAAGASCTISVTFTPSAAGTRSSTLAVSDDAPGSPQTASLTGTGLLPPLNLSSSGLTFPGQLVGTTSPGQTLVLSNPGSLAVSISSIGIGGANSGDFSQNNNCGSTLAGGGSCTITVTFTPSAGGTRTATLSVSDNAAGSPQTASLTGTGLVASASLSTSKLNFGNVNVGTTSAPQPVTLINTGTAALAIGGIGITGSDSGDYAQTNNCGGSLAADATCTINVTFNPSGKGHTSATLSVSDNASDSPQQVSLMGNGH
jgi:Abnormal spindle-like microcephaly-assoc'd, ASPM-SPD-2-Hydin/Cep192 domain 4